MVQCYGSETKLNNNTNLSKLALNICPNSQNSLRIFRPMVINNTVVELDSHLRFPQLLYHFPVHVFPQQLANVG
jgi:hypothetical protein